MGGGSEVGIVDYCINAIINTSIERISRAYVWNVWYEMKVYVVSKSKSNVCITDLRAQKETILVYKCYIAFSVFYVVMWFV